MAIFTPVEMIPQNTAIDMKNESNIFSCKVRCTKRCVSYQLNIYDNDTNNIFLGYGKTTLATPLNDGDVLPITVPAYANNTANGYPNTNGHDLKTIINVYEDNNVYSGTAIKLNPTTIIMPWENTASNHFYDSGQYWVEHNNQTRKIIDHTIDTINRTTLDTNTSLEPSLYLDPQDIQPDGYYVGYRLICDGNYTIITEYTNLDNHANFGSWHINGTTTPTVHLPDGRNYTLSAKVLTVDPELVVAGAAFTIVSMAQSAPTFFRSRTNPVVTLNTTENNIGVTTNIAGGITPTSIVLSPDDTQADGFYNGSSVLYDEQTRVITDYSASTLEEIFPTINKNYNPNDAINVSLSGNTLNINVNVVMGVRDNTIDSFGNFSVQNSFTDTRINSETHLPYGIINPATHRSGITTDTVIGTTTLTLALVDRQSVENYYVGYTLSVGNSAATITSSTEGQVTFSGGWRGGIPSVFNYSL